MSINGYDLSHRFYEWAFENRQDFKPTVSALYFYLVEVCNRLGWKNEFSISAKECMEGMGVSGYNTYKNAFDILCDNGFITVVKKSCNHYQANIITLSNFNRVNNEVTDELPNRVTQEYRESNSESNGDIHKTNKTVKTIKTDKTVKHSRSALSSENKKTDYSEYVSMKAEEYDKLVEEFTEDSAKRMIEILNNYKGSSGKKYKSDYMAIRNWVVARYNDEMQKNEQQHKSIISTGYERTTKRSFRDTFDERERESTKSGYRDTF